MYWEDAIQTKTSQIDEMFQITSQVYYTTKLKFIAIHIGAKSQQGNFTSDSVWLRKRSFRDWTGKLLN